MERKPRVLVVDDENVVCASFERVLTEEGYFVNEAHNGFSAMEKVGAEPYDIAFVDLKMPGMNGLEVARKIRQARPETQVVIVTGYGTPESASEAAAVGVLDFVSKPLTPDHITQLAARAWEKRKAFAHGVTANASAEIAIVSPPVAAPVPAVAPPKKEEAPSLKKALGMMIGGSLLGLAYVVFLPLIGFGMLLYLLGKKLYSSFHGAKSA